VESIGVVVVLSGRGNVGTTRPPVLLGSEPLLIASHLRHGQACIDNQDSIRAHEWVDSRSMTSFARPKVFSIQPACGGRIEGDKEMTIMSSRPTFLCHSNHFATIYYPASNKAMSQSTTDRQPLLPTHVDRSSSSRLARPKISFPSSSTSALASTNNDETVPTRKWTRTDRVQVEGGERQGVPKLSRECLWR
jgi:hypothetical protein